MAGFLTTVKKWELLEEGSPEWLELSKNEHIKNFLKIREALNKKFELLHGEVEADIKDKQYRNDWLHTTRGLRPHVNDFTKWLIEKYGLNLFKEGEGGRPLYDSDKEKYYKYFIEYKTEQEETAAKFEKGLKHNKKEPGNFKFVGTIEQLNYLYNEFYIYKFIKEKETTPEDFINVFTKNWNKNKSNIFFGCNIPIIVYIIDKMKVMFDGLIDVKIENSKKFYNKLRKNITASSLYRTRSEYSHINEYEKNVIDNIFNSLPK